MSWRMGWVAALLVATPLAAQERVERMDLPRSVADEVIEFFNRATTTRYQGPASVGVGELHEGDVAVLSGSLTVGGEIRGNVVVVNGDLEVLAGGRISGDVTVIGGVVVAGADAVEGQLTVYSEALEYGRRDGRITRAGHPWSDWRERHRSEHAYFSVRSQGNYNRVEGLPVMAGPVFRSEGDDFLRADLMGVWRSESGLRLDADEMGYFFRLEQHVGPGGRVSFGGTAHSLVTPIEDGGITNTEASLATLFLGRDYRDYFEREGFSAFVRYSDEEAGVRLTAEYRDEDHAFAPVGDPWSFKDEGDAWRAQPLVAEGRIRTLGGQLLVDDRNDREDPSDGWYMSASAAMGLGGGLRAADFVSLEPGAGDPIAGAPAAVTRFRSGSLDLRRYTRLGPAADLRLRGFAAGSLDGEPLPPQFQRALGGEGSLPGFPLMAVDCGARTRTWARPTAGNDRTAPTPVYRGYGCDRVALFQAEYRGSISFDWGPGDTDEWDDDWSWAPSVSVNPSWAVFFDAGRGWSLATEGTREYLGPDTDTLADVGFGIFLGDLGLYWAWPLNGQHRDPNFFVRLSHRF